jgi:hypothetical protein
MVDCPETDRTRREARPGPGIDEEASHEQVSLGSRRGHALAWTGTRNGVGPGWLLESELRHGLGDVLLQTFGRLTLWSAPGVMRQVWPGRSVRNPRLWLQRLFAGALVPVLAKWRFLLHDLGLWIPVLLEAGQ